MKQLKQFIQEKLHVGNYKKLNKDFPQITNNNVVNKILYVWGFGDKEDEEFYKAIENWVNKNNVDDIQAAADLETYNEFKNLVNDHKVLKLYDTSAQLNEECQYRLNSAKVIYDFEGEHLTIYAAPDILAFCGHEGTLYCLPTYTL